LKFPKKKYIGYYQKRIRVFGFREPVKDEDVKLSMGSEYSCCHIPYGKGTCKSCLEFIKEKLKSEDEQKS
jgi:hypothetical protein